MSTRAPVSNYVVCALITTLLFLGAGGGGAYLYFYLLPPQAERCEVGGAVDTQLCSEAALFAYGGIGLGVLALVMCCACSASNIKLYKRMYFVEGPVQPSYQRIHSGSGYPPSYQQGTTLAV